MRAAFFAVVLVSLGVGPDAALAASAQQTLTFNIEGAQAIAVEGDVDFEIVGSATADRISFSQGRPPSAVLTYTSVMGRYEGITATLADGALPSGVGVTISASTDGKTGCGTGHVIDLEGGGWLISDVRNGIGCRADLDYDLVLDDEAIDPAESGASLTVVYTLVGM